MPITPAQAAHIAYLLITAVLFIAFYLTHQETYQRNPRWFRLAVAIGALVSLGLTCLPSEFAAGVGKTLGGVSLALFIVWRLRITDLGRDIDGLQRGVTRGLHILHGVAFEAAMSSYQQTGENPHRFVDRLAAQGAIDRVLAQTLHSDIILLRQVEPPRA